MQLSQGQQSEFDDFNILLEDSFSGLHLAAVTTPEW